jgi:hypothetical protein
MYKLEVNELIQFQSFLYKKELIKHLNWETIAESFLEQQKSDRILIIDFIRHFSKEGISARPLNFLYRHFVYRNFKDILYMDELSIPFIKQFRGSGIKTISELSQVWDFEKKILKK